MIISFDELRKIKDALPDGSIKRIATQLSLDEDTVRNYFGGAKYEEGAESVDFHIEKSHNGAIVKLEDNAILKAAQQILSAN